MQPLLWKIRQLCDHIHQPRSYAVSWKYSFRDRRREGRDHGAGCSGVYDGNDPDAAGVMREHAEKLGCPYYELKRRIQKSIRSQRTESGFLLRTRHMAIPFLIYRLSLVIRL